MKEKGSLPCHILNDQLGADVVQQHVPITRIQMYQNAAAEEIRQDLVCRRGDELLRQRVEDRAVAGLPCLVRGVDGDADAGQVQVVDDVGVAGGVLAVPVDVVGAEAVGDGCHRILDSRVSS